MFGDTTSNALAIRALDGKNLNYAIHVLYVILGVALIALSAKIQLPFWPVPMILQTLAIMAIFAAYGMRLSLVTIIAYLATGLAGLPVFAGPVAGPAYFIGPTAGFLAGFVIAAMIVGLAADRGWARSPFRLFGAMLVADAVIFTLGFIWLGFIYVSSNTGNILGAETAFNVGVKPYILADLVKMVLAASIIPALARLFKT